MGFWMASVRRCGGPAFLAAVLVTALTASAASAVSVSLPTDAVISAVGQDTVVNMTIGSVSNLAAVTVSFTYDSSIVTVPMGGVSVLGSVVSTCGTPTVGIDNASMPGRVTIALACSTEVSGSGTLFAITFHGVANGVSPLTFSTTGEALNGCSLESFEGTISCEPSDGQITVGTPPPTNTPTTTLTATATGTQTNTPTNSPTATSTSTQTNTPTATDTVTIGPSPTPTQTRTASNTATITLTPTVTLTPSITGTATVTRTVTSTGTATLTRTITPTRPGIPVVPSPTSPAGLVLVTGLGAALLWALRRLASAE